MAEFAHRYGPRANGWTMPESQTKRDRLGLVFAQDGYALCQAAWSPAAPAWIRDIETLTGHQELSNSGHGPCRASCGG